MPVGRKILFFGGSFDPPHIGHLILPRDVMETFGFQKVIFIPTYISPFKAKRGHRAAPFERLEMVRLAVEDTSYYDVESYEIYKGGISYTFDTVQFLRRKYNLKRVYWLMGDDTFLSFDKWFRWRELLNFFTPVVAVRTSDPDGIKNYAKTALGLEEGEFLLYRGRRLEVSSTEIRNRLRKGLDVRFMVPEKVLRFIEERGIYTD
jgi:nicotinate-nucleotide adenylyltransferase